MTLLVLLDLVGSLKKLKQPSGEIKSESGTLAMCCNPSRGARCCLDEFKAQVWSGRSRSREKATASRSLCYPTPQLLHRGTGIPEEQSQEAVLAKCSTKSHSLSQVEGSILVVGDIAFLHPSQS